MAKIKLEPAAAQAVTKSLKSANLDFDTPTCDCFDGHDSQSEMMAEFEQRVREVRKLIGKYQTLLENDVNALEQACRTIILSDHMNAAMHNILGQGKGDRK